MSSRFPQRTRLWQPLVWLLWVLVVLWVSYRVRFWINNDTIGSLDSARLWQQGDVSAAINAYWGSGFALLLNMLPLTAPTSWLGIHLLAALCVLVAQGFVYQALRHLHVAPLLATGLALLWGASCYATGGALFITADSVLLLWAAIIVWVLARRKQLRLRDAALLGTLHAGAGLTKSIALPGLMLLPLLLLWQMSAQGATKRSLLQWGAAYTIPLCLLLALWSLGSLARYGRIAFDATGVFNYANYVTADPAFIRARFQAQHHLPEWGTFWWSDVTTSLEGWDGALPFDAGLQLQAVGRNVLKMIRGAGLRDGATSLLLLVTGVVVMQRRHVRLPLIACVILLLYLLTNWTTRFWPFLTLFALPDVGIWLTQQKQRLRYIHTVLAAVCVWNVTTMVAAALWLAPNGAHFEMAAALRSTGRTEALGAYLADASMLYHHGVIGFLLGAKTAEMIPTDESLTAFISTFEPSSVLLATEPDTVLPSVLTVATQMREGNDIVTLTENSYMRGDTWLWRGSQSADQLTLYRRQR